MTISSLRSGAIEALKASDLDKKVSLTNDVVGAFHSGALSLRLPCDPTVPERPGRPEKPELVRPGKVERRSLKTPEGRFALLHALAHIELNAIDLALDIIARFCTEPVPRSFFTGWLGVAADEAKHFTLVRNRLRELGGDYGDLPAHDGLWSAAHDTRDNLHARLAIVPLVLEARGLDVTPSMSIKLDEAGDHASAEILRIIYEDEKTHVAVGAKWFRFFCARNGQNAAEQFQLLVRRHFRGDLKPPFNRQARAASGLTTTFYQNMTSAGRM